MPLFRRNINGWDLLAIRRYIDREKTVERSDLIRRFYPGDPDDPDQSAQRKNLNDAIDFLIEANQIISVEDGYEIEESHAKEPSARVALLSGLRNQGGENATYNDVLEALIEEDLRYFDHRDQLEDLMSGRRSEVTWNETRLGYWLRTMETMGVAKRLYVDSDENHTAVLSLERSLLRELLHGVAGPGESRQLREVLDEIDERYLPIYAGVGQDDVATYVQAALSLASRRKDVSLGRQSDYGQAVEIRESGYNSITITTETTV